MKRITGGKKIDSFEGFRVQCEPAIILCHQCMNVCVNWPTRSCSLLLVVEMTENYQLLISKQLRCSYDGVVKAFLFFSLNSLLAKDNNQ